MIKLFENKQMNDCAELILQRKGEDDSPGVMGYCEDCRNAMRRISRLRKTMGTEEIIKHQQLKLTPHKLMDTMDYQEARECQIVLTVLANDPHYSPTRFKA